MPLSELELERHCYACGKEIPIKSGSFFHVLHLGSQSTVPPHFYICSTRCLGHFARECENDDVEGVNP